MAKSLKDMFIKAFASTAREIAGFQGLVPSGDEDLTRRSASMLMKNFPRFMTMDPKEADTHPVTKALVEVVGFAKDKSNLDAKAAMRAIKAHPQCEAAWDIYEKMPKK